MPQDTHQRSWSLGDQEIAYMFAHDYDPHLGEEQDYIGFDGTPNPTIQQSPSIIPRSVPQSSNQLMPWAGFAPMDTSTYITNLPSSYGPVYGSSHSLSDFPTNSSGSSTANVSMYEGVPSYFTQTPMLLQPHTNADVQYGPFTRSPSIMPAMMPSQPPANITIPEPSIRRQRPPTPRSQQMSQFGTRNDDGTWSCHYDKCKSECRFRRLCDLKKHYIRHDAKFYCLKPDCPESEGNGTGFSSKKDCARHMQKHDPKIVCDHAGCKKIFSRKDNMRDHVRRIHDKPKLKRRATTKN